MKLAPLIFLVGMLFVFPGCGGDEGENPLSIKIIPDLSPILPGSEALCAGGEDGGEVAEYRLRFARAEIGWKDGTAAVPRFLRIVRMSVELVHDNVGGEYDETLDVDFLNQFFQLEEGNVGTTALVLSNENCHLGFGGIDINEDELDTPFSTIATVKIIGLSSTSEGLDPRIESAETTVEVIYEP